MQFKLLLEFTVFLSSAYIICLKGNPIPTSQSRWLFPCSPPSNDSANVNVDTPSISRTVRFLQSQVNEVATVARRIREIYRNRIQNRLLIQTSATGTHIEGLQMDYIHESLAPTNLPNIDQVLQDDYQQFFRLAIYWDMIMQVRTEHEDGATSDLLHRMKINISGVLCTLQTVIRHTQGGLVESNVTRSEVASHIGNDSVSMQRRIYFLSIATINIVEYLEDRYNSFLQIFNDALGTTI